MQVAVAFSWTTACQAAVRYELVVLVAYRQELEQCLPDNLMLLYVSYGMPEVQRLALLSPPQ